MLTMLTGANTIVARSPRYRRLAIRYERRADIHQDLLDLACAHIRLNFLRPDGFC